MKHSPTDFNERILLTIFSLFGIPKSLLDIGCGDGSMVRLATKMGVWPVVGVDINKPSAIGDGIFVQHDLRQKLDLSTQSKDYQFEMVLCLETAEHIPPGYADDLVWTLTKHSSINGRLIFSAALPGQGGEGHVNLQPPTWWRKKLWDTGKFSFQAEHTARLALLLSYTAGPLANWIPANIQVF